MHYFSFRLTLAYLIISKNKWKVLPNLFSNHDNFCSLIIFICQYILYFKSFILHSKRHDTCISYHHHRVNRHHQFFNMHILSILKLPLTFLSHGCSNLCWTYFSFVVSCHTYTKRRFNITCYAIKLKPTGVANQQPKKQENVLYKIINSWYVQSK